MKAAIYSRKSVFTGKGDSVEHQIILCKEYAEKYLPQIDEFLIYEDEGFSGGNINRPEFQRLLKDARQRNFDVLICYRLDRISRNVADFSSTLELLQDNNIAFISIREQFDTSTPMGKAMVYIASVFAQLERETIAERVRDNMLELAKIGRWLGGQCPLGFGSEKTTYFDSSYNERSLFKLTPLKEEMNIVRLIFDKYHDTESIHMTLKYLLSHNIKGKNGGEFSSMSISDILRNPVYVLSEDKVFDYLREKGMQTCGEPNGNGILIYNKRTSKFKYRDVSEWIAAVSGHKGIIAADKWLHTQMMLDKNSLKKTPRQGTSKKSLLSGLLKCARCGSPMRVSYGRTKRDSLEKIYYYVCTLKAHSGKSRCDNPNVRGDYLENQIVENLMQINVDTVIRELENSRRTYGFGEINSLVKDNLNNIEMKKKKLESLISQLSKLKNSIAQEFLIKKIDALGNEIKETEKKLLSYELDKREKTTLSINTAALIDALKEFSEFFTSLEVLSTEGNTTLKKRYILERAVESIIVDGETKDVIINLWGTNIK